jgi:hypothetical protein
MLPESMFLSIRLNTWNEKRCVGGALLRTRDNVGVLTTEIFGRAGSSLLGRFTDAFYTGRTDSPRKRKLLAMPEVKFPGGEHRNLFDSLDLLWNPKAREPGG